MCMGCQHLRFEPGEYDYCNRPKGTKCIEEDIECPTCGEVLLEPGDCPHCICPDCGEDMDETCLKCEEAKQ